MPISARADVMSVNSISQHRIPNGRCKGTISILSIPYILRKHCSAGHRREWINLALYSYLKRTYSIVRRPRFIVLLQ